MIYWIFTHSWIFILGLLYMVWTVYAFSDGIKCFKRNMHYAKREKKPIWKYSLLDWKDDYGEEFLWWLAINGTILFLASLWCFMLG